VEVVASLSQGRTAAAQCGLFTHKSVPVIFEPPCILPTFGITCCLLLHGLHDWSEGRVWTLSKAWNSCIKSLVLFLFLIIFWPLPSYRTTLPSSVFKIPFLSQLAAFSLPEVACRRVLFWLLHFHCSCFPLQVSVSLHSPWFWFTTIWSLCVYSLTYPDPSHFVTENGGILFPWNLGNASYFPLSASPENKTFVYTRISFVCSLTAVCLMYFITAAEWVLQICQFSGCPLEDMLMLL